MVATHKIFFWHIKPLHFVYILLVGLALVLSTNVVSASDASTCADFDNEWYKCLLKQSDANKFINSICNYADTNATYTKDADGKRVKNPTKKDICTFTLTSQLNMKPSGIPASSQCGAEGVRPSSCYVKIKSNTDLFKYAEKLVRLCKTAPTEQVTDCAKETAQEFLESKQWEKQEEDTSQAEGNVPFDINASPASTAFIKRIRFYLQWIFGGIGVLAIFGFVLSSVQYAASGDNPQGVVAAKKRMQNVVIGIFIYIFMFAFLQWLIPGGLFAA